MTRTANYAPTSLLADTRALTVHGKHPGTQKRSGPFLRLVDLDLILDVVERIGDLRAKADRPRLVAAEQRRVVSVEAVADGLRVAHVALDGVLVVAMVPSTHQRVIAVDSRVAIELVGHRVTRACARTVSPPYLVPGVQYGPVGALQRLAHGRERLEGALHAPLHPLEERRGRRGRLFCEDP